MAEFDVMLEALAQGHSVLRAGWEPGNRIFVSENALMWQCGTRKPSRCALTWEELSATDWRMYENDPSIHRVHVGSSPTSQIVSLSEHANANAPDETTGQESTSIFLLHQK